MIVWTFRSPLYFLYRYFFMKLQLSGQYDVYGVLKVIHNWMPLLVITSIILSKASVLYREYLIKLALVGGDLSH